jgi:cold-inducible RNA-binding protein
MYVALTRWRGRQRGGVIESGQNMGTRLFVGNLSFNTTEVDLRNVFTEAGLGVTEVKIVTERETGRPRGFAFVEMIDQASATKAIEALNQREMDGRALNVNEARERAPRVGGGSRY